MNISRSLQLLRPGLLYPQRSAPSVLAYAFQHIRIRSHHPQSQLARQLSIILRTSPREPPFKLQISSKSFARSFVRPVPVRASKPAIDIGQPRTLSSLQAGRRSPKPATLQSGYNTWTTILLLGTIGIALLYNVSPFNKGGEYQEEEVDGTSSTIEDLSKMTGEEQPGRPGTLTLEQEEKLREFWIAVLQVFGVLDKEVNGHAEAGTATPSAKKPKKKRLGLFRKKDSDDTESVASESSGHQTGDTEDKYGQTKEFHEALTNQSPESLRATFWSMVKHDHPDALLLRFLRARKWNVENALVMMVSTMRWRSKEMHVDDDVIKNGELAALENSQGSDPVKKKLANDFLDQMRMGKSFLHGLDKGDQPITIVRARLHKQGEQSEESLERYTVFLIESARMLLSPPVDTACIIFDMTGFSLANMDYAPVKFMIKCFEANYPESLGVVLVHKAPWVFQGIWKIIRGWLDPVVASKVQFTNNKAELEAYIPESRIIRELDGPEDWSYSYVEPIAGENDRMQDTVTRDKLLKEREGIVDEYEKVILQWVHGEGDGTALKKQKHDIAARLRDNYWAIDPYIRARTYYDRIGIISEGGKLNFYPSKATEAAPATTTVNTSADDVD